MKLKLLLLVSVFSVFSCNYAVQSPEAISYQYTQLRKDSKNYITTDGKTDTSYISIKYPKIKNPAINNYITNILLNSSNPDQNFPDLDSLMNDFVHSYDRTFTSLESFKQTWFKNIEIQITNQTPVFITLKQNVSDYTGGAHGNYNTFYYNFDVIKSKEIKLEDLVGPENVAVITGIAEEIFRSQEGIEPTTDLEEGYFFKNGTFSLNDNFEIGESGLKFSYNPYEIKPYAAGITELIIPYKNIKNLVSKNSVISAYIIEHADF